MGQITVDKAQASPCQQHVVLKRAAQAPLWGEDDYDVLADGARVGRIMHVNGAPRDAHWFWTLCYGYDENRSPTHGYAATREQAMAALAKSWRRD